jgi:hypothetical protein
MRGFLHRGFESHPVRFGQEGNAPITSGGEPPGFHRQFSRVLGV